MAETAIGSHNPVTVVLLGHEQPDHRARAVYYYREAGIPCLAVEPLLAGSSGEQCSARLAAALQQVATPFVTLALDADFVLPSALQQAAACLHAQPEVQGAQGYALAYAPGNAQMAYHKIGSAFEAAADSSARARLRQYAMAGQPAWRAVLRVGALQALLDTLPGELDFAAWRVALSYALVASGDIAHLAQTDVVCEYAPSTLSAVARDEQLTRSVRLLREWDGELANDDAGFAVLNRFVRATYDQGEAPLLFTSPWGTVIGEPERIFEPRQYVELPYYNGALFECLTALEFLCHAWPTGQAHRQALEGTWVRQRELLQVHPNDTAATLQQRYWKALALGLFNLEVCRRLVPTLTGKDDGERARELGDWLARLEAVPGIDGDGWLRGTVSGQVLEALAAATPDKATQQRLLAPLNKRPGAPVTFVVTDLADDDLALQATFDSLLASGLRQFKLVVLKGGKPPAITTARDTLHFVQVNESNWVTHLNQQVRQLSSDWLMLLDAGDTLVSGGLLRLQQELAEASGCQAVCANEVQRDSEGRLHGVVRPGSNLDLLRAQPGLMSRHWCLRRQTVVELGGFSETCRHALEFDVLLRLVEQHGQGGLAHMDEYLVVGNQATPALQADAVQTLKRHLTLLGYRGEVHDQGEAGLVVDFRHSATPLVSILVAAEGDLQRLQACLTSVLQRTRYPRYELRVACNAEQAEATAAALQGFGQRVVLLAGAASGREALLNLAAEQAAGEYLLLLAEHCEVISPAWIEGLLNEGLRPEVGVVGARLLARDGTVVHAGFDLLQGPLLHQPWQGLSLADCSKARWPASVRNCAAVSADCMLLRRDLFDHCGGLQALPTFDLDVCLAAAAAGLLVAWTPVAQLFDDAPQVADQAACEALQARWPSAFSGQWASDALSPSRA
ncbi:glycosyl transferase [Pseudomonas sp. AFG_SD02_1510_Pfu_092]|uniref:glycosyltransferase family 2 protein n=1 Tax=Pseudomonas sp. AFG_SD02_1510_Pfu_092 TaxID=2259497 RepID=UPI000DEF117B|nr:glycosyltransferase [Pseudomonas sp. AFG_SD02_1510_Pfu_092]RCL27397.1 glycosyl transferase [Pseudomonas sp. AFG_SD02_1510_Pfu_092]